LRPLRRRITQTGDANAPRQASIDCGLDQARCEEGERYRHIDLSNAAFFAFGDVLDVDGVSGDDLV
jgi:hypothetical protein